MTPGKQTYYHEALLVCLHKQGFTSGVQLDIQGDLKIKTKLVWASKPSQDTIDSYHNIVDLTNIAAVALSIVLFYEFL